MQSIFEKKNKILGWLIFVTAVFPYISPVHTPFDTQPWALVFALLFIIIHIIENRRKISGMFPKPIILLFYIFLYAALVYGVHIISHTANPVAGLRSLWGYLSFVVLVFAGYKLWPTVSAKTYIAGVEVWLFGALAQLAFGVGIVSAFLPRFSTGGYRGLTSFAPEPAFYATLCISLLVLNEFFYREKKYNSWWYFGITVAILAQIILSYSGMGIMLLLLFGGAKGLELLFVSKSTTEKKKIVGIIFLCIVSVSMFFFNHTLRGTRAAYILDTSLTNPGALFQKDLSVSNRLGNPILALYGGVVETHGTGFGLGSKSDKPLSPWIAKLHGENRLWGGRIEGGLVQAIYELGLIGFIFLGIIIYVIFKSIINNKEMRGALLTSSIAVFVPFIVFGSIATPLLGLLFGVHLYYMYVDKAL